MSIMANMTIMTKVSTNSADNRSVRKVARGKRVRKSGTCKKTNIGQTRQCPELDLLNPAGFAGAWRAEPAVRLLTPASCPTAAATTSSTSGEAMIKHDNDRRTLLHNANAAAASLDDTAERNRLAMAAIRKAMRDPSSKAALHRAVLLPMTFKIERLSAALSSWATVISWAATPVARGNDLSILLPKMLAFSHAARDRLHCELRELAQIRDHLRD